MLTNVPLSNRVLRKRPTKNKIHQFVFFLIPNSRVIELLHAQNNIPFIVVQLFVYRLGRVVILGSCGSAKFQHDAILRRQTSRVSDVGVLRICTCKGKLSITCAQKLTSKKAKRKNYPLFHNFEVTGGGLNWLVKKYGFICDTIFLNCTHVHKSLSNET